MGKANSTIWPKSLGLTNVLVILSSLIIWPINMDCICNHPLMDNAINAKLLPVKKANSDLSFIYPKNRGIHGNAQYIYFHMSWILGPPW